MTLMLGDESKEPKEAGGEASTLAARSTSEPRKGGRPWCDYCRKPGHIKDKCWKVHGKSTDWKPAKERHSKANLSSSSVAEQFSKEQLEVLQKLLTQGQSIQMIIGSGTDAKKGEANFLGGVARVKGVTGFDPEKAKKRFFEIYLEKYAKPNSGIGFPGALELIMQCKNRGLKVAVASSADRIKVDANLAAAGLPISVFDAIVSADAFENLKPAPDIFLAASRILNVDSSECLVIEDALAGVQAAKAAQMRCIAVTTTLSKAKLQQASPSLIKENIGNITIHDILDGGQAGAHSM